MSMALITSAYLLLLESYSFTIQNLHHKNEFIFPKAVIITD